MSGPFGQFAEEIDNEASVVAAVNTEGVTGAFGEALNEQKQALSSKLDEFSAVLSQLEAVAEEHKATESTFVSTAPTLAEVEAALQELQALQAASPSVSSPVTMLPTVLDVSNLAAVEAANQRYTELSQRRRDAVRIFLEAQGRLGEQINSAIIPGGPDRRSGSGISTPGSGSGASVGGSGAGASSGRGSGTSSPSSAGGVSSRGSDSSSESAGGGSGRASVEDVLASGTPVAAAGAGVAPMMYPQAGMMNQPGITGRFGPQVVPGYTLPGTVTSAGQASTMSDREFNSLLDRIRPDRAGSSSSAPSSSLGSGGGAGASGGGLSGGSSAIAAPRLVQPTSWSNASSPTGVSESQAARAAAAASQASPSTAAPAARAGGMPMAPMGPMGGNPGGPPRDPKDQPQIKNADPDVYGDDVKTLDPIIDNQKGRFT
ncbi:hypothetical protein PXH69_21175 [Rhodococcus qingshengii]|uniref:PPE domain-containing protein n=1 Tax=Rhodococcus qingshengii TaxID=334542 RepID=A0AAW6LNU6_RHOSG|nr:hypothetical protein [Rhodococcus qingshengii]MDE8647488.1 hypothetical protein [Rhodococcus qingshengii]